PEPHLFYLDEDGLAAALGDRPVRRFTHFESDAKKQLKLGARLGRDFAPERQTADANVFEAAGRHIAALLKANKRVAVDAWSDGAAERLPGVLSDHGVGSIARANSWSHAASLPKQAVALVVLPLEHGFETDDAAFICEQDILGDRLARPRKRRKASA